MQTSQRRLILVFKSFIQKALIPQIKKMQGSLFQWNKFNSLLSLQTPNLIQLQSYVDSLLPIQYSPIFVPKQPINKYVSKIQQPMIFNPSKTFGGDRARLKFGKQDEKEVKREDLAVTTPTNFIRTKTTDNTTSNQGILQGIERILRIFNENQNKLETAFFGNSTSTNTAQYINRTSY